MLSNLISIFAFFKRKYEFFKQSEIFFGMGFKLLHNLSFCLENLLLLVLYASNFKTNEDFYRVDKHIFLLLQPEVVEKLVNLREGIPRKDAKEVNFTLNSRNIIKISTYFGLVYSFVIKLTAGIR